jgi:transcriptional regulator with XRE-family HTH domain
MPTLGKRLASIRGKKNQADFGAEFGKTQATISDWERDRVQPPIEFLVMLAKNYSVDLNWLITGDGKAEQVAESPVPYKVDQDMADLARALERHPRLVPIVRGLLKIDGQLVQDSESLSRMLDVPIEVAALFLAMKHHHHAK